jgi:hypothetical protein
LVQQDSYDDKEIGYVKHHWKSCCYYGRKQRNWLLATALLLAERGAKVVLVARGSDHLEALTACIENAGGEVAYARTDV